jgi:peptidoglycan/LPS O-acetylase OafA/YrhL
MFRVYPAFFVAVLSCYALHVITGLHYFQPYRLSQMLDNLSLQVPLRIYWTVGVEVQFYLLFPLLACMLLVLPWQAHTKTFLLAIAWGVSLFIVPALDLGSIWSFIGFFLGGILAGQLYTSGGLHKYISSQAWNNIVMLCLAGLVLLVPAVSRAVFGWDYGQWEHYHLIAPLMLLTVLSIAYSRGFLHSCLSSKPSRFIGAISYSLYLVHYTVFILIQDYTSMPVPLSFLVNFAIAMLLAWGLYRWVEYPLNQMGKRLSARIGHGE